MLTSVKRKQGEVLVMLKRAQELTQEVVHGLRGGKGDAFMTKLLEGDQLQGKARIFNKMILPPGNSVGFHQHTGDVEAYYILSGEGAVRDNDRTAVLKPGDVLFTANGESHSIENSGTDDLVFIALILYA
jgi:mannose-6-phosphate isomerase-like protein (cupin superfamily)